MELSGEYVGPDGVSRRLQVSRESSGDADLLQNLLSGVAQMRELVVEVFAPEAQRDPAAAAADPDDASDGDDDDEDEDDDDDEEDAEDENNIDNRTNSDEPSAKRLKPPS